MPDPRLGTIFNGEGARRINVGAIGDCKTPATAAMMEVASSRRHMNCPSDVIPQTFP